MFLNLWSILFKNNAKARLFLKEQKSVSQILKFSNTSEFLIYMTSLQLLIFKKFRNILRGGEVGRKLAQPKRKIKISFLKNKSYDLRSKNLKNWSRKEGKEKKKKNIFLSSVYVLRSKLNVLRLDKFSFQQVIMKHVWYLVMKQL